MKTINNQLNKLIIISLIIQQLLNMIKLITLLVKIIILMILLNNITLLILEPIMEHNNCSIKCRIKTINNK